MIQLNIEKYHKMVDLLTKNKEIELNKKYWVSEWSWMPIYDGIYPCEEIIREHAVIDGIDCYFTNKNNRVYFKEDIFENKEDAEEMCKWQNSFSYDYDSQISKANIVNKLITFENYHWKLK